MDDFVLIGWKLKDLPDSWVVRNLLNAEPVPKDDWEPVFVEKEGANELLAYRAMLVDLAKTTKNRHASKDADAAVDAKLAEVRTFLMGHE